MLWGRPEISVNKMLLLVTLLWASSLFAQYEVSCSNGNCTYPSDLNNLSTINLPDYSRFEASYLDDDLYIRAPANAVPRDFMAWIKSRSIQGQDVEVDLKSTVKNVNAGQFVLIGDSIKNLSVNSNGFSSQNFPNSSTICAQRILNGDYGSTIRSSFVNRRNVDPTLPADRCDQTDLLQVQNNGALTCAPNFQYIPSQLISAERWMKKKECTTSAGRELCVAKRVILKCDLYADKPTYLPGNQCCDHVAAPTSSTDWKCDPLRCDADDSGWYLSFTFRMWEEEYKTRATGGQSNSFICEALTGSDTISNDVVELKDKSYTTSLEYVNSPTEFNIYPPVGENVVASYVSAGVCSSVNNNPTDTLNSFSEWFTAGIDYIRMSGKGRQVNCSSNLSDYTPDDYCYKAIQANANPNACTGQFDLYMPGNKCWEELLPTCTSPNYEDYDRDSYCYNKHITNCQSRVYSLYPNDGVQSNFCHKILKERQCGGVYTDYQPGSTCWKTLVTDNSCVGTYSDYPVGSFCYNKQAPNCTMFDVLDPGDEVHPNYNFCTTSGNIQNFPDTCNPAKSYSDYPLGSKCWNDNQPVCPLAYTSYPTNSFCWEKKKPACLGVYTDYSVGTFCYDKLLPQVCSAAFETYPAGSFCHQKLMPVCSGVYTDYSIGSFCYNKLSPTCPGVYTDYPVGSFCRRDLTPKDGSNEFICEGQYSDYPAGSYCWEKLQPECTLPNSSYLAGSYCYNATVAGQHSDNTQAVNCLYSSGPGSMCWKDNFPACVFIAEDINSPGYDSSYEDDFDMSYGSYCWHKKQEALTGYCYKNYSEYPRGSACWINNRANPDLFSYSDDTCSVKCEWNGTFSSCDIGNPTGSTAHVKTPASYYGQRVKADSQVSFKVRFKILTEYGREKTHDTEIKIRVKNSNL